MRITSGATQRSGRRRRTSKHTPMRTRMPTLRDGVRRSTTRRSQKIVYSTVASKSTLESHNTSIRPQFIYLTCIYRIYLSLTNSPMSICVSYSPLCYCAEHADNQESSGKASSFTLLHSFLCFVWISTWVYCGLHILFCICVLLTHTLLELTAGRGMSGKTGEGSEKEGNVHIGIIKPGARFPKSGWAYRTTNVRSEPLLSPDPPHSSLASSFWLRSPRLCSVTNLSYDKSVPATFTSAVVPSLSPHRHLRGMPDGSAQTVTIHHSEKGATQQKALLSLLRLSGRYSGEMQTFGPDGPAICPIMAAPPASRVAALFASGLWTIYKAFCVHPRSRAAPGL